MAVDPPRPSHFPLKALRAFEAAARHESFASAAEELGVTAGAVSAQVRLLENWAGHSFFKRTARGIELTAVACEVADDLHQAFDSIGRVSHRLRTYSSQPELRVATLPSIAQLWLAPRLDDIRKMLPHCSFEICAIEKPANLLRESFDCNITLTDAPCDHHIILAHDTLVPVCSPELSEKLKSPADLGTVTLLHDTTWHKDWATWLQHAGVSGLDLSCGHSYSLYAVAVEEAKRGAGVLIGHTALLSGLVASGELVMPFGQEFDEGKRLVIEHVQDSVALEQIDTFISALSG